MASAPWRLHPLPIEAGDAAGCRAKVFAARRGGAFEIQVRDG